MSDCKKYAVYRSRHYAEYFAAGACGVNGHRDCNISVISLYFVFVCLVGGGGWPFDEVESAGRLVDIFEVYNRRT